VRDWLSGDDITPDGNTRSSARFAQSNPQQAGSDVYDFEQRLIRRTRADGSALNISWDADGNRISKVALSPTGQQLAATNWLVDTNSLTGYAQVAEESVDIDGGTPSTTHRAFTFGASLIAETTWQNSQPAVVRYFAQDGQGSTRELTDAAGAVTDRYDFDAFGLLLHRSGTTANAYQYRGEQFDEDLGLYYLRARFFDPGSGRFWTFDPHEGSRGDPASLHKFAYAGGNPVSGSDPSGHLTLLETAKVGAIVGTLSGMAVGGVNKFLTNYQSGKRGWELAEETSYGVLTGGAIGAGMGATFAMTSAWLTASGYTLASGTLTYGSTAAGLGLGGAEGYFAWVEYEFGNYFNSGAHAFNAATGLFAAGLSRLLAPRFTTPELAKKVDPRTADAIPAMTSYKGSGALLHKQIESRRRSQTVV
jgi:RHS repeat-associated protein